MTFNGLKGADFIVFNYILENNNCRLSMMQIAQNTCYTPITVSRAVRRLEGYALLERHRSNSGSAYIIKVNQ